jgi:tRNA1Val (adenine37-N6)-methyltransferase
MYLSNFVPNSFFQFKQFTVHHDRCAMKVGTDGVLLGAWTNVGNVQRIIDIGTGTGLISLMLAQRNRQAKILGIDIDESAVLQAKENIENSPFSNRISIENRSVQAFADGCNDVFDLVVSNPPFFADSLLSPKHTRTLARHTETLPLTSLFDAAARLLSEKGILSIIYPIDSLQKILDCAEKQSLFLQRQTTVFPTPGARPKRVLLEFSEQKQPIPVYDGLIIEVERHRYSDAFRELVRGFYLRL